MRYVHALAGQGSFRLSPRMLPLMNRFMTCYIAEKAAPLSIAINGIP